MTDTEAANLPEKAEPPRPPKAWSHVLTAHATTETEFRLFVQGPYGVRELRNMVKIIEAQIEILGDEVKP